MFTLECDLCGNTKEIGHLVMKIDDQAKAMEGHHVHICGTCRDARYDKALLEQLAMIEKAILEDVLERDEMLIAQGIK